MTRLQSQALKGLSVGLGMIMAVIVNTSVKADELLYVYGPHCAACQKFQAEVGNIYDKTEESKILPITKVTLDDWKAGKHPLAQCQTKPVFGTPTFLHIRDCTEIDRITGYSNDELFWLSFGRLVNRAKEQ